MKEGRALIIIDTLLTGCLELAGGVSPVPPAASTRHHPEFVRLSISPSGSGAFQHSRMGCVGMIVSEGGHTPTGAREPRSSGRTEYPDGKPRGSEGGSPWDGCKRHIRDRQRRARWSYRWFRDRQGPQQWSDTGYISGSEDGHSGRQQEGRTPPTSAIPPWAVPTSVLPMAGIVVPIASNSPVYSGLSFVLSKEMDLHRSQKNTQFDKAIARVTEALMHERFDVLTTIDVQQTMNGKCYVLPFSTLCMFCDHAVRPFIFLVIAQ